MFKKKDLCNGMVIEMNTGERRLFWNNRLIDETGYIPISNIDECLYDIDTITKDHIVKIYLTHDIGYFRDFLRDENLTCIWERQ